MIRSTEEWEMSRSCHSATSSSPACALPRSTRASPTSCSDLIGLRLWGIALDPFWPAPNGSLTSPTSVLARLRISVANRSIPAPATAIVLSSSAWRSRGTTWVDTGSRSSPSLRSTRSSKSGEVAEYVPTAPEIAPTSTCANARSSLRALRSASKANPASLTPNVVGSAWIPCVRPTHSVSTCSRARSAKAVTSLRETGSTTSATRRSWSASPVSSTSLEVNP